MSSGERRLTLSIWAACVVFLVPVVVQAQGVQLSPAQQQMLDQLPAAQRQQAMIAIRQLESQQSETPKNSINEPIEATPQDGDNRGIQEILKGVEVSADARSRLVVNFSPLANLTPRQRIGLDEDPVLSKLIGSHLFVLDEYGVLSLQGLEMIPLLGLNESDINRRLSAEPFLDLFEIDARILGQEPIGLEALKPFGYEIFEPKDFSFDAPTSGPAPHDYVLGPGDTLRVQLFGNVNGIYELEVSRNGVLNLPEIGPVTVAGISFSEVRKDLDKRVQNMLIGTQVSVTMGQLRTIRVFVLGDVNQPGSHVVSGLSTISAALYRSGGISPVGTLRNIQLKRSGRVVSTLDVYDLLIRGDTTGDARLQPGDVVFVPPIGKTVAVGGAVNRPAIYEVKRLTSAADLVTLSGGLTSEAFAAGSRLERVDQNSQRSVIAVNLDEKSANDVRVENGDKLLVPKVLPELANAVFLAGHVYRPGSYPWRPGMRLTDLVPSSSELKPGVDTDYVLIRREGARGQPLDVLSASLANSLASPNSQENIRLEAGDTVNIFSRALGRQRVVEPLLEEIALQSTVDAPVRSVEISGNIRAPGVYPLEGGMRISDLIRAGGSLTEQAYVLEAELTRYEVADGGGRTTSVVSVDLDSIRRGVEAADLALREHDYLIVKRVPEWNTIWSVTLEGEVAFPGRYRIRRGETLLDVLDRAGGLTQGAFSEGAVFLRESLKDREQEQLETLAQRMEADLASLSLQSVGSGDSTALTTGNVLLEQLRAAEAVGRLVIDLTSGGESSANTLEMRDGDRLLVPTKTQVVTVLGETQQNTSHVYKQGMSRDDYIDLSGGLTRRADKKLIYVVRANGAVVAGSRSRWFGRARNLQIRPGDTIVVPLDTDRMRPLTFWGNVTQILYQGAIAVAAVKTFNN